MADEKNKFGTLNADGSIAEWPEVDLNGQTYERPNATRAGVGGDRFVVVPMNVVFDDEYRAKLLGNAPVLQAPPMESFSRKPKGEINDQS